MRLTQIKSMRWSNEDHTEVCLVADIADDEENASIGTPYDERSIIWADVQAFPKELIEPYTPPIVDETI